MIELYHVVTRGVEGKTIFLDTQDYARFVHDLYEFNDQAPAKNSGRLFNTSHTSHGSMSDLTHHSYEIDSYSRKKLVNIHAFCLMPNHTHLLLSPLDDLQLGHFMRKLNGGYAKYFNAKYSRKGRLYQSACKIIPIISDAHYMHIGNYIHFNPLDLTENHEWRAGRIKDVSSALDFLSTYKWSSYLDHIGTKNFPSVINQQELREYYDEQGGYLNHVKKYLESLEKLDADLDIQRFFQSYELE